MSLMAQILVNITKSPEHQNVQNTAYRLTPKI